MREIPKPTEMDQVEKNMYAKHVVSRRHGCSQPMSTIIIRYSAAS